MHNTLVKGLFYWKLPCHMEITWLNITYFSDPFKVNILKEHLYHSCVFEITHPFLCTFFLIRGQTDNFTMVSRNLGHLKRCIVGAVEREDKQLGSVEGREAFWHCHRVAVTNRATGDEYVQDRY